MKTVLTIAGSDSSGGAGIQADLKTMIMNGVYGMSAVTALTAQNTTGVREILEVPPEFLKAQIDAVFEDIRPDAVKIGMVANPELIRAAGERLRFYQARHVVVDPVMAATSGSRLLGDDAARALEEELFSIAEVVTPNIPEAEAFWGKKIGDEETMLLAAQALHEKYGCAVLLKGGHALREANDVLYAGGRAVWFRSPRVANPNTHGTGCTLSSAIAAGLAKGYGLSDAVERAKEYIGKALEAMLDLGEGSGPLDHGYLLEKN